MDNVTAWSLCTKHEQITRVHCTHSSNPCSNVHSNHIGREIFIVSATETKK